MNTGPIKLIVENVNTKIQGVYPYERIDKATSYYIDGCFHSPLFKAHVWDGKEHLLKQNTVPTGLVPLIEDILKEVRYPYIFLDQRTPLPPPGSFKVQGVKLRPYQCSCAARMLLSKRGVVEVPTAGGKTLIAAATIKGLGVPTAYMVHTTNLLEQTLTVFEQYFDEVGVVGAGRTTFAPVTIFMVQTLTNIIEHTKSKEYKQLQNFRALFCDECHHVASDGHKAGWYQASRHFSHAYARFGLSATPVLKKHGLLLQATTGPLIYTIKLDYLQKKGYIATATCRFYTITTPSLRNEEYAEAYKDGVVRNTYRNKIAVNAALEMAEKGRASFMVVERVEHGERILKEFEAAQEGFFPSKRFEVVFLCRENSTSDERQGQINRLRQRDLKLLVATRKLFGEGTDIPAVDAVINLCGGKSAIAVTQVFGRGLRLGEDKTHLLYIDFLDKTNGYLHKHSSDRMARLKALGQNVEVML